MAKELPYFKFEPNQWENGNIQMCSNEDKGLFIELCCMYWSRLGDVPLKLAVNKLCAGNATAFDSLIKENIFTVIDGLICIDFLNEQLGEFDNTSKKNSKNAKDGWVKRRLSKDESDRNATAFDSQSQSDAIREEKIREEDKKVTIKNADAVLTEKFVLWFNEMKFKHKGIKGSFKTLSKTDISNLKELKKANYTPEEFEHAYKVMVDSVWTKTNSTDTPTHFLINNNFSKYVNTVVSEQSKFNPYG